MDYNNQIIATRKGYALRTYKTSYDDQPGIALINNDMMVYIEGREW